jgi:5'-nucleotidase
VKPYTIVYKKGLKIGLLGVCPEMEGLVTKENYDGITYMSPIECGNKVADYLKNEEHCDLVIAISHLGWKKPELGGPSADGQIWDQDFISFTRNIDIVVGGHSHTYFQHPEYVNNLDGKPVICNQMGKNAQYVGTMTIEMNKNTKK